MYKSVTSSENCTCLKLRFYSFEKRWMPYFNKMEGVPKRVENFLKEGFGDTRHLSIGLHGFGMFEIKVSKLHN